ncbi:MAG: phosphatidylglycerophosphatase A [Pseudomonadales bacterium]|nr:phosphatidylglycerophosphatase A [Pseudomonadales bacterium]
MNSVPEGSLRKPVHFLALGFGSGTAPFAPGTFGTLAAIPIFLILGQLSLQTYLISLLIISITGIWICGKTAHDWGIHDHPAIVWDEFAGFLVTMIAAPMEWKWIVIGFLLFRLFDIWKPYPIKMLDTEVSGGFGIMVDDIVAGLYALIILQLLIYYLA